MAKGLHCLAALVGAGLLASCRPVGEPEAQGNLSANTANEVVVLPVTEPAMDRAALLAAVARAGSDAALGKDDREAQRLLDGRTFEVRMRFGCPGSDDPSRRWEFGEERRVLRVRANPDVSSDDAAIARIAGAGVEAVEGFWFRRPWLHSAGCPAPSPRGGETKQDEAPKADPAETIATPRIGIAQFFTADDPRTERRGRRPYEATKTLAADETPSTQGYDLVLSGRLEMLSDGRVIACVADDRDVAPACIVSVEFDRVWIERPGTGEIFAEWGSG